MPAEFKNIDSILEQINDKLLSYRLNRHCPEKRVLEKTAKLDRAEQDRFLDELEKKIDYELDDLLVEHDGLVSLSPSSPLNIVSYASEAAEYLGMIGLGIERLLQLKKRLVSHQQEIAFSMLKSYLNILPTAFRSMLAEEDSDRAFMMDSSPGWLEERGGFIEEFRRSLDNERVYDLEMRMAEVSDVLFGKGDLKTGAAMLKALEESLLFYAISPSGFRGKYRQSLEDDFGGYAHDYASLWIRLEEMGMRISNLSSDGEGILMRVFNSDDYAEDLAPDEERLKRRKAEIGKEDFLQSVREDRVNLENILKQIAVTGPMHLSLVQDYLGIFVNRIKDEAFGIMTPEAERKQRKRYLVIREPKSFMVLDSGKLRSLGLPDENISGLISGSGVAYGIISAYTPVAFPLRSYSGPLPPKAERFRGKVYKAERVKVIDIYDDEDDVPEGVLDALRCGRGLDDPEISAATESAGVPKGSYQLRMPYQVLMLNDLSVISERRKKKQDHKGGPASPVVEIYVKGEGDRGIHDQLSQFVDAQPYSRSVSREGLESRIKRRG